MKRATLIAVVLTCAVAVEALLILRAWMQATAAANDSGATAALFALTADLAAPFALVTDEPPRDETGVIDFTILVAIEGYFIATLAFVAIVYVLTTGARLGSWLGASNRSPDSVEAEPSRIWQPHSCSRWPGGRLYVPSTRRDGPVHTRAGLTGFRN